MEKEVLSIIKIGAHKFMETFFYEGEMYFDTVDSFRKKDINQERFDTHEGATEIEQINWMKLRAEDGKEFEFSKNNPNHIHLSSAYLLIHGDSEQGNIYSCTAVTYDTIENFKILDTRFRSFGDVVIIIQNPREFINRVTTELKRRNYDHLIRLVNYYEPTEMSSYLSVFEKKSLHSYQNEIRIWIKNFEGKPIKIHIGSIKDIACRFKMEELMNSQNKLK